MGPIYVADMTEPEIEDEIRNRLVEADLLPDPIVQVVVVLRRQLFFHVLGDVVQQGTYPISQADLRLLDALAFARRWAAFQEAVCDSPRRWQAEVRDDSAG